MSTAVAADHADRLAAASSPRCPPSRTCCPRQVWAGLEPGQARRLRRGPAGPPLPAAGGRNPDDPAGHHLQGRRLSPAEPARPLRAVRADRVRAGPDREDHRAHPARQDHRGDPPAAASPRSAGDIPVIYITVPPGGDPEDDRDRVRPVPRPPGHPPRQHHRHRSRRSAASAWTPPRTLICVDEIHNLNLATRARRRGLRHPEVLLRTHPGHVRLRRDQTSNAPGCSSAPAGEQIAGRFSMIRTGAVRPRTSSGRP